MLRPVLLTAAFAFPLAASAALTPSRLRCEYLTNPLGLGEAHPRLSWIVTSPTRGDRQTAYRILVAASPARLAQGKGDLWDSGRIASNQINGIPYMGRTLRSGERAWWTVTTWDGKGAGKRSAPAFWEMGLLSPKDWQAQWIGMPVPPTPKGDVRWLWYPGTNPAKGVPAETRFFRKSFDVTGDAKRAVLAISVDDRFEATLNGKPLLKGEGWRQYHKVEMRPLLKPGRNELVVKATNDSEGPAGFAALGEIVDAKGKQTLVSNATWEAGTDGEAWVPALAWAKMGDSPYTMLKWTTEGLPSPQLRRDFNVARKVRRARLYASARGLYRVSIDGKPIPQGVFDPGWTDYHKRIQYQTYDVTPFLQPGAHALNMSLGDGWYCGKVGLTGRRNYGDRPMGLAQLEIDYTDGSREWIVTNRKWQVGTGPIRSSDLLDGEVYDARRAPGGWTPADVEPIGSVPLVPQHSVVVERVAQLKPRAITEPQPGHYVFDLGQNMVGWARLRVQGKAGETVRLRFAEMLNPDGTIYTTNLRGAKATDFYTLKGGAVETYEPSFTFHGFRYVELTGFPGKPGNDAVTGVVVTSGNPQTGTFACSNPMVNQLQHNIQWGQRGNYLDVPTDCPQRDERLGWMADAQVFVRTATFNEDVASFLTKWTDDVKDAQSADGGFSDVSPRMGDPNDGAPAWGDAGVIVPWTVYKAYGDRRLLERHYPEMAAWIGYIEKANPDGLWLKRRNNDFGDWLNANDETPHEVIATAYYAYSTDLVARTAAILGKKADAERYAKLHDKIKAAFNEAYVDSEGKIKGDSQTDYVVALKFGLLPEAMRPVAAKRLADHIMIDRKGHLSTGFVGVGYLNPVLTANGYNEVAYRLLQNDTYPSWGYSIRQGATTIWERWDGWTKEKGFQDPGMNSFNHYSLGSVGEWMATTVAGIDMATPGYEKVLIRPQPGGGITWARGRYDSIRGPIATGWRETADGLRLNVEIPANTLAYVYVPASDAADVREGKTLATKSPGVKFLRMEDGAAVFQVGGGRYEFLSAKPK